MIKKTITYTDYNGLERTEDFWFNITEAEALEMEMSTTGGYGDMIRRVVAAQDMPTIIKVFKDFIFKAYGEKSPDGKRFVKSEELSTCILPDRGILSVVYGTRHRCGQGRRVYKRRDPE